MVVRSTKTEQQYRTPRRPPPDAVYTPFDVTSSPYTKHDSHLVVGILERLKTNLSNNLFVWWENTWALNHYVKGSLLDALSGILAIIGIGVAVGRWKASDRFLLAWLVLSIIPTALLSPYGHVPLTRFHVILIPLALLCGCGVSGSLNLVKLHQAVKYAVLGVLLVAIVALNLWRFENASHVTLYGRENLAIVAWHSQECGRDERTLFIAEGGGQFAMNDAIFVYMPEGERPEVIAYEDPRVLPPWPACRIFFKPEDPGAQQRLKILTDVFSLDATVVSNPTGKSYVVVIP